MAFFYQVKLLLWKNYLLRKRSKIFTLVELLWPLMLFLILTWVRTKELKKSLPECHFEPKSMPSTGLFEFFRSAICSFNNTCLREEYKQPSFRRELSRQEQDEDIFATDQNFSQILADVDKVQNFVVYSVEPSFLERTVRVMNYTANVEDPSKIPDLSQLFKVSWYSWLFGFPPEQQKLTEFLAQGIVPGGASRDVLTEYVESATKFLDGLSGLGFSEPTKDLISRMRTIDLENTDKGDAVTQVFPGLGNETGKLLDVFWPLACGVEFNHAGSAIQRAQKNSFDEIVNRWQFEVEENYTADPEFSPFCNKVFHKLQSTPGVNFFWKQLKPFIAGKLLYTPAVEWTDRIMERVNNFWGGLKEFFDLIRFLRDVLPLFSAKNLSESPFAEALRSERSKENFKIFLGGFSAGHDLVDGMYKVIDWIGKPEAEEVHQKLLDGFETFLKYAECFQFDKAQPVPTEADLVGVGQNLTSDNKLWAGLVFYPDVAADNESDNGTDDLFPSCRVPSKTDQLMGNYKKKAYVMGFNESYCDNSTMPKFVVYKIRMDGGKVDDVTAIRDRIKNQGPRFRPALDLKFVTFGFAYLQDLVEHAIVEEQMLNAGIPLDGWMPPPLPGIVMQQFPYPCYIEDRFIIAIERTFPMFMVLSWVFSAAMIIRSVVYEKELRLKETMRVMGLSRGTHWVAWTIASFVVMSVSAVLLAGLLVVGRVLDNTSFSIVLLFLLSYSVATLMLAFFMSCFFSRANLAAAAGGIWFFVTYLPYPFLIVWEHSVHDWLRVLSSGLSNVAFGFGCDVLAEWEELGIGAHWHNLFESPDPYNTNLSLGSQIALLWLDALIYCLLAVYIEGVFPGRYGVPLPWWYPFSLSYWSGRPAQTKVDPVNGSDMDAENGVDPKRSKVNEPEPTGLTKGVELMNLRKVYDTYDKVAVDNLNLSFFENQITAFLGHNGAGKTTTISILTGLLQPTSGTAKIYDQDIRTEMDAIRKSMGVCPQHNVLFHDLTVEEHLKFYGGLKGTMGQDDIDEEVQSMIKDLGLPHKRGELARNLSGGMQRKLSIAISFLAKSRTVFLDEPTAGVDPHSRRAIWKLLTKYKKGRTVILTTHHMDEAEILGDRIAIISQGALVCSGSALFLKNLYGSGYILRVVFEESYAQRVDVGRASISSAVLDAEREEKESKKRLLMDFLRRHYDGVRVSEEVGAEVAYLLPWSKGSGSVAGDMEKLRESHVSDVGRLQKLLEALDANIEQLPITSYGISDTKLEEIFLQVTSDADVGAPKKKKKSLLQRFLEVIARGKEEILTTLSPPTTPERAPGQPPGRRGSTTNASTACCAPFYADCVNRVMEAARRRRITAGGVPNGRQNGGTEAEDGLEMKAGPGEEPCAVQKEASAEEMPERRDEGREDDEGGEDPTEPLSPRKTSATPRVVKMGRDTSQLRNVEGGRLLVTQFFAVEAKRYHHAKRDSRALFCQLVLPVLFVTLAMMSTSFAPGIDVEDEYNYRELHHWHYHSKPVVFFQESNEWREARALTAANRSSGMNDELDEAGSSLLFLEESERKGDVRIGEMFDLDVRNNGNGGQAVDPYVRSFLSPTGMGTRCVHGHYYFPCKKELDYNVTDLAEPANGTFPLAECACTTGGQSCPADAGRPEPALVRVPTSDVIVNVTDRNPNKWIINTHQAMKLIRYGGFTFGLGAPGPFRDSPPWNVSSVGLLLAGAARAFNATLGDELAARSLAIDRTLNHDDPGRVRGHNDTSRPYIKVWFFNKGWISSVAFMNAVNNVILRTHLEAKFRVMNSSADAILPDYREYGFAVINHPISTDNAFQATIIKRSAFALLHSICVIYAMSFVPAAFVVYLIEDRITGSKHLQFVSGLPPWLYWVAAYVWDLSSYFISAALCVFVFLVFDEEAYVDHDTLPGLLVLMIMYGFATVPLMYPFSFFFETSSFAFVALATANLFIGIVSTISTFVLEIMEEQEFQEIAGVLKQVFLIFPQYCLGRGLMEMAKFKVLASSVAMILDTEVKPLNVFEWTFLGRNVVSMFAQGVIGFAVTLLIQYRPKCGWVSVVRFATSCCCFRVGNSTKLLLFRFLRSASPTTFGKLLCDDETNAQDGKASNNGDLLCPKPPEDEDVARERRLVLDDGGRAVNGATLKVVNLTKVYQGAFNANGEGPVPAVNGTCFAVRKGECFGLLGVNGAGKTTTFKMLTGDVSITSGDAFVDGWSVKDDLNQVRRRIGYCPQFDALDPLLTSREHLYLYARLRGLPSEKMETVVDSLLERMNLGYYADRKSETYSGGNKRKLSTAIALVGNPPLVFLDEPTSGMDAGARRFLWNCILELAHKDKRCVILTSHSMEECEALCARLAIMVSGSFRCIGSVQHLKNKFGSGYTLSLHAAPWDLGRAENFVTSELAKANAEVHLQEGNPTRAVYHLPHPSQGGIPLAAAFKIMEQSRELAGVLHYSISQTTLDEVFVRFAMESRQHDEELLAAGPSTAAQASGVLYRASAGAVASDEIPEVMTVPSHPLLSTRPPEIFVDEYEAAQDGVQHQIAVAERESVV